MTIQITHLGLIHQFNGMDTDQTKWFDKIHNSICIYEILENKKLLLQQYSPLYPIPMRSDSAYQESLGKALPVDEDDLPVETELGFKHRQGVDEILYVLVTCSADICYPLI